MQKCLAEFVHNITYLLWEVFLNIQLSKTVLHSSKCKVVVTKYVISH